jgi:hypothetical protein
MHSSVRVENQETFFNPPADAATFRAAFTPGAKKANVDLPQR